MNENSSPLDNDVVFFVHTDGEVRARSMIEIQEAEKAQCDLDNQARTTEFERHGALHTIQRGRSTSTPSYDNEFVISSVEGGDLVTTPYVELESNTRKTCHTTFDNNIRKMFYKFHNADRVHSSHFRHQRHQPFKQVCLGGLGENSEFRDKNVTKEINDATDFSKCLEHVRDSLENAAWKFDASSNKCIVTETRPKHGCWMVPNSFQV